jgi:hypothetical protein
LAQEQAHHQQWTLRRLRLVFQEQVQYRLRC